jgi:hypothetical protein
MKRLLFVALLCAPCASLAQPPDARPPASNGAPAVQMLAEPGRFATALASDARGVWIGTEDRGLWFRAHNSRAWRSWNTQSGLAADDVSALYVDAKGRVWTGHGRDGLSVLSGGNWATVGPQHSPWGERVFALAAAPSNSPRAGQVWVAGNRGLAALDANGRWIGIEAAGFPAHQVTSLALNHEGDVFAGTECDGVWSARLADNYQTWTQTPGAEQMPDTPHGEGLPDGAINALAARGDEVWAGTPSGLARSVDRGRTWKFWRGRDWKARLGGLARNVAARDDPDATLLHADWVESLALKTNGDIVIGYRDAIDVRDSGSLQVHEHSPTTAPVRALQSGPASTWAAVYSQGVLEAAEAAPAPARPAPENADAPPLAADLYPLPPFFGPTRADLARLARELEAWPAREVLAAALPDDWRTRGDWLGRYGRHWACLSAIVSPRDYIWGAGAQPVTYAARVGRTAPNDSIRYYIHALYSADPNALEMPPVYFDSRLQQNLAAGADQNRRTAEWNDMGHEYPTTHDGPDILVSLDVPPGDWVLAAYNWNKDGRGPSNSRRDYRVSLHQRPADSAAAAPHTTLEVEQWPTLAHGRMRFFNQGVYKRFFVRGPRPVTLRVARHSSHNTMLSGVFLDPLEEKPAPYFSSPLTTPPALPTPPNDEAQALWSAIESARKKDPARWLSQSARFSAPLRAWYEKAKPSRAISARLATLSYDGGDFETWERWLRLAGERPARDTERALKWDGVSNSTKGFQAVQDYVVANPVVPAP